MIRITLPLICAALGFAAASCSQSEAPFTAADAPGSSQPTSPASRSQQLSAHSTAAAPNATPADSQAQDSERLSSEPEQTTAGVSDPATATPDQATQSEAAAQPDVPTGTDTDRRASTLMEMPVVSADGNPLGTVKDIIFDRQGRASHLVIAYAAQADGPVETPEDGKAAESGADAKLTAMPWDAAVASMKDGQLVLDGAKLQDAPSFTPDAWPNLDDPGWSALADTYWRKAVRAAIAAHPGAIDSTARQRGRRSRSEN